MNPILLSLALAVLAPAPQEPATRPAAKEPAAKEPAVLKVGDKLPASFQLKDLDGKPLTAADLKSKVVCFVFWSTQCPIMVANQHKLVALHKDLQGKPDVLLVAVNANAPELGEAPAGGKDGYGAIRSYMKENALTFRVLADHGNVFADQLAARTTPHCYVFDKEGVLRYAGAFDDDIKAAKEKPTAWTRNAIEACVAGKKVEVPTSEPWGCTIKRMSAGKAGR